jgi:hypothetical protein
MKRGKRRNKNHQKIEKRKNKKHSKKERELMTINEKKIK